MTPMPGSHLLFTQIRAGETDGAADGDELVEVSVGNPWSDRVPLGALGVGAAAWGGPLVPAGLGLGDVPAW